MLEFVKSRSQELAHPELLGLPATTGKGPRTIAQAKARFENGLINGNEEICKSTIFDLYLNNHPVSKIFDEVMAEAFQSIGDKWACSEVDVYQERRACEICSRVIHELYRTMPKSPKDGPLAIGAAPSGDVYGLPTSMVEMVLRQNGWRAESLGANIPFKSLIAGCRQLNPRLFWISASHIVDTEEFVREFRSFYDAVGSKVAIVVGGRALTDSVRREIQFASYCENLQNLEAFSHALMKFSSSAENTQVSED